MSVFQGGGLPAVLNCWPTPWEDGELERLRRLKQRREAEEEKERLRQWLRRHGVPEHDLWPWGRRPCPPPPYPLLPLVPWSPCPNVGDILRRLG